ncbi:hypothetical protein [Flagellimonas algicola]|uniref:Uncharacterized protein n=1 Tax=Flagellimonas algicola TaxID=2583815 RepID=A0ABY2WPL2_9FLAO|nr:hypothetical protein [Allomuricauda algicola]TMU56469.1 hypothetical protein FGG15_02720 [Allomuricauda algicola]
MQTYRQSGGAEPIGPYNQLVDTFSSESGNLASVPPQFTMYWKEHLGLFYVHVGFTIGVFNAKTGDQFALLTYLGLPFIADYDVSSVPVLLPAYVSNANGGQGVFLPETCKIGSDGSMVFRVCGVDLVTTNNMDIEVHSTFVFRGSLQN